MDLSVCVLAGDDTDHLPRALDSVANIAEELLLVSTRNNDKAKKIGAEFGAHGLELPWTDDFAATRNTAFATAQGQWIFSLDADEWMDEASRLALESCITNPGVLAWLVNIHDRSGPGGAPRFSPTPLPRLFRRVPELRLTGRVHEHFEPEPNLTARQLKLSIEPSNITIFHDGYRSDRETEKLRRNIRLMDLELQDRPGQLFYQIRLSQALLKIDDPRALQFLRQAWEQIRPFSARNGPPSEPLAAELLDSVIVRQIRGEFDSGEPVEKLLKLAQDWFPRWPPLIWRRANWQFKQERFVEAADALEEILRLARDGTYQHTPSFDAAILAGETHLNLGICYARLRRFQEAERCFILAAQDPARQAAAEHNIDLVAAGWRSAK
jgi:hypothetical protein